MLFSTASVLFAVFALVALLAALVLCASILTMGLAKLINPGRIVPVYRLNLHVRSIQWCALVIALAEFGAWLTPRIASGDTSVGFPVGLWVHLLLVGLLSTRITALLDSFVRTSTGKGRFPGDRPVSLLSRAAIALSLAAWISLVPVILHLHLPDFPAPNVPVLLPLLAAVIGSLLLVINDDWVRFRLHPHAANR